MSNKKGSAWYSAPRAKRKRKGIELMFEDETHEVLSALAEGDPDGRTRSEIVEALIWKACEEGVKEET